MLPETLEFEALKIPVSTDNLRSREDYKSIRSNDAKIKFDWTLFLMAKLSKQASINWIYFLKMIYWHMRFDLSYKSFGLWSLLYLSLLLQWPKLTVFNLYIFSNLPHCFSCFLVQENRALAKSQKEPGTGSYFVNDVTYLLTHFEKVPL